jgi:tetratricopeptide (TPR) repeat protein
MAKAKVAVEARDLVTAKQEFSAVADTYREILGEFDINAVIARRWVAVTVANNDGAGKALDLLLEVSADVAKVFGPDHPHVAYSYADLGRAYATLERWNDAEKAMQRCRAIRAGHDTYTDEETAIEHLLWARIQLQLDRQEEAQRAAEHVIAITALDPEQLAMQQEAYLLLGESYSRQEKYFAATKAYEHAFVRLAEKHKIAPNRYSVTALDDYANALRKVGQEGVTEQVAGWGAEFRAAAERSRKRR